MKSFKDIFEDTVSADIAQATTGPGKMQRRGKDKDCPCKKDPMSEECQRKRLGESPVGSIGRTGVKDAIEYISPELRAKFKKIVKELGGKTVARELLNTMNSSIQESTPEEQVMMDLIAKALEQGNSRFKITKNNNSIDLGYKGQTFIVQVKKK